MRCARAFLLAAFVAVPAFSQNGRSAVSVNGTDANPCTPSAPCRSFSAAVAQTVTGGEIIALDSAGYGPFTIDHAVNIAGAPGVHAAITATSGAAITVLAGDGTNNPAIRNLVLVGNGGTTGIATQSTTDVRIVDCIIRGFTSAGIDSQAAISVENTTIIDNPGAVGIRFGNGSTGTAHGSVTNSTIDGNTTGLLVLDGAAVAVRDCQIDGNANGAAAIATVPNDRADLTLEGCTIAHNSSDGVQASATGMGTVAAVLLARNVVAYNGQGVDAIASGGIYSFVTNRFVGNGSDGTPMISVQND